MYEEGVDGKYFYIGDESTNGYKYGVVNIAAFLAQVMKESLNSNSCDENNWQAVSIRGSFLWFVLIICGSFAKTWCYYR